MIVNKDDTSRILELLNALTGQIGVMNEKIDVIFKMMAAQGDRMAAMDAKSPSSVDLTL